MGARAPAAYCAHGAGKGLTDDAWALCKVARKFWNVGMTIDASLLYFNDCYDETVLEE
jgi:hypothetical protein